MDRLPAPTRIEGPTATPASRRRAGARSSATSTVSGSAPGGISITTGSKRRVAPAGPTSKVLRTVSVWSPAQAAANPRAAIDVAKRPIGAPPRRWSCKGHAGLHVLGPRGAVAGR